MVDRDTAALPLSRPAFPFGTHSILVEGMTALFSAVFPVSGAHTLAFVAIFNQASEGAFGSATNKSMVILAIAGSAMATIAWADRRDPVRLTAIR